MKLVWDGMGESVFVSEIDMKDHQYCDRREHLLGYLHTVDGIVIQINAKFWVSVNISPLSTDMFWVVGVKEERSYSLVTLFLLAY